MMRTPRSICWLCLVVGVGSPSCAGEPGGEKTLSQEQFLAILKARGEFKQPDGAYTIKVKRVGGGKLVGVEVSFEASDGGTAKVSSDLGVLKFNDKNEVELYCEKCEVQHKGAQLSMVMRQWTFPAPMEVAKKPSAGPKEKGKDKKE